MLKRIDLKTLARSAERKRGRAGELERLFEATLIPMVWCDNDRRVRDGNPACRLFLRQTRAELRSLDPGQLVPHARRSEVAEVWQGVLRKGCAAGSTVIRAPDGPLIPIDYCGVANLLPGAHLLLLMPSHWETDELGAVADDPPPPAGRLSAREREVLAVLCTGATLEEISRELSLSPHTVKTHLRNACRRLGARHRAHAVALALRDGQI
jgi:DNA-binding CsgD family transcriptional regulator